MCTDDPDNPTCPTNQGQSHYYLPSDVNQCSVCKSNDYKCGEKIIFESVDLFHCNK